MNKFKGQKSLQYTEAHHIIPVFMFVHNKRKRNNVGYGHLPGDHDDPSNFVHLPLREHLIAHALLAKMHSNTRYKDAAACGLCFFFSKGMGLAHPRSYSFKPGMSKKYEWLKKLGKEAISRARKGKFPAKNAITGISAGSVSSIDPRVLSGELIHCTKGIKASKETCEKIKLKNTGMGNGNAKPNITLQSIIDVLGKSLRGDNRLIKKVFMCNLKKELNCTSGLLLKRNLDINTLISAYKIYSGRDVVYEQFYREDTQKYSRPMYWITNGYEYKRLDINLPIPEGWNRGRKINNA
jgi:hypothetical protein